MQLAQSQGGRWGWETRLREAEADLNAVKAKRASGKPRSSITVQREPQGAFKQTSEQTEPFHKDAGLFKRKSSSSVEAYGGCSTSGVTRASVSCGVRDWDTRAQRKVGYTIDSSDWEEGSVSNTVNAPSRERCSFSLPVTNVREGADGVTAPGRRNTTCGAHGYASNRHAESLRRTASEAEGGRDASRAFRTQGDWSRKKPQESGGCKWGEPQRSPSVGDRWACQVLMEELNEMKIELQKAKSREGALERQLKSLTAERDSIQRLWESEHNKVAEMKRNMEVALSSAGDRLRARLSDRSKPCQAS